MKHETYEEDKNHSVLSFMIQSSSFKIKAEKREAKRRKRRSHKVSGKKVIQLARLIEKKGQQK